MATVFQNLIASRKAWVMMIAIVAVATLNALGRIEGDKALEFIKWVVMTWIAAQGVEDAAVKSTALKMGVMQRPPSADDPK